MTLGKKQGGDNKAAQAFDFISEPILDTMLNLAPHSLLRVFSQN